MNGPDPRDPHCGTSVSRPALVPPSTISGDTATVRPCGEFDMANQRDLGSAIHDAIISDPRSVVVDLREVTFIDAGVIRMLLRNQQVAESRRCELTLINVTGASALVLRALRIGPPLWDGTEAGAEDPTASACLP